MSSAASSKLENFQDSIVKKFKLKSKFKWKQKQLSLLSVIFQGQIAEVGEKKLWICIFQCLRESKMHRKSYQKAKTE